MFLNKGDAHTRKPGPSDPLSIHNDSFIKVYDYVSIWYLSSSNYPRASCQQTVREEDRVFRWHFGLHPVLCHHLQLLTFTMTN